MRILQTPPRFYPYIGGVENYVYFLSRELVKMGHQVKVFCADEPKGGDAEIEGIQVKRLAHIAKVANTNITYWLPKRIFQEDCDLIHTHLPTPWSADVSAQAALLKNKPLVLTYFNDIMGRGMYSCVAAAYNFTALKILLKLTRKIIVLHRKYVDYSPYLKKHMKKIEIIPPGVDLERFQVIAPGRRNKKTVLFLGLLDEYHRYKGLDYLIRAMSLVKNEIPEVRLVIGGGGILEQEYRKLSVSLGLEGEVEFAGTIPMKGVAKYYEACDVFVLPSLSSEQEGFGIVLLEAMACGRPVITTDITGPAEKIKESGSGIVVAPQDIPALAEAIRDILKDENYALKMGMLARRLVEEQYSWSRVAQYVERLYYEIQR